MKDPIRHATLMAGNRLSKESFNFQLVLFCFGTKQSFVGF